MSAPVELIPVEQVGPQRLSPRLWRDKYLVRKNRRRHWQFYPSARHACRAGARVSMFMPPAREACRAGARVLPVDAGRRGGGVGEPVETDIVEHCVDGEFIFGIAVVIGPRLEFFVDP